MAELVVDNLSVSVDQTPLVKEASFSLRQGSFIALLGPNGAGKTSLLRASLGLETHTGSAVIGGIQTDRMNARERARSIAYLPQVRTLAWPNRVRDVVALGRFSHGVTMGRLGEVDQKAVDRAIEACDLSRLANRRADTLSGGELARLHCARAFAAETPLLVADEPIASLDPRHQFRILDLFRSFVDGGGGALIVLHDLYLAARYVDKLIWMKEGRIVAHGSPSETYTPEIVSSVFDVEAEQEGDYIRLIGAP